MSWVICGRGGVGGQGTFYVFAPPPPLQTYLGVGAWGRAGPLFLRLCILK